MEDQTALVPVQARPPSSSSDSSSSPTPGRFNPSAGPGRFRPSAVNCYGFGYEPHSSRSSSPGCGPIKFVRQLADELPGLPGGVYLALPSVRAPTPSIDHQRREIRIANIQSHHANCDTVRIMLMMVYGIDLRLVTNVRMEDPKTAVVEFKTRADACESLEKIKSQLLQ